MSKSAEEQARKLLQSDMAGDLELSKLSEIANSPAGMALRRQMSGAGGDKLRKAATQAADGDTAAVSQMLTELMSTNEGKALAEQVMEMKKQM